MRQDFFEYTPQFKLMIAGTTSPGCTMRLFADDLT
jgi:hypothetical protein